MAAVMEDHPDENTDHAGPGNGDVQPVLFCNPAHGNGPKGGHPPVNLRVNRHDPSAYRTIYGGLHQGLGAGAGTPAGTAGTAGAAMFLATLTVDGVAATLLLLGAGENREEDEEDEEDEEEDVDTTANGS